MANIAIPSIAVMHCALLSCVLRASTACLSTEWASNRCFAWTFGTVAVLAQGGGVNISWKLCVAPKAKQTNPLRTPETCGSLHDTAYAFVCPYKNPLVLGGGLR